MTFQPVVGLETRVSAVAPLDAHRLLVTRFGSGGTAVALEVWRMGD